MVVSPFKPVAEVVITKLMSVFEGPFLPAGLPGMQTSFCVYTRLSHRKGFPMRQHCHSYVFTRGLWTS